MNETHENITIQKNKEKLANMEKQNWERFKLKPGEKIFTCKKCLTLSTRPRAQYDENGICNACKWHEMKNTQIDWDERKKLLKKLCDKYRVTDGSNWDVIVPCSGGKDGSSVAWLLKNEYDMHPLCITLAPHFPTEIGQKNLDNFIKSGFDHIKITPHPEVYRRLAIKGFVEQGRPKLPFNVGVSTALIRMALKLDIPLVMYGEEGEGEYGGSSTQSQAGKLRITREYLVNYYYSGHDPLEYRDEFSDHELKWWTLPEEEEFEKVSLNLSHWSYYENWDPYKHYLLAKKHCGFQELPTHSVGTYTNFAQLDDKVQDLHAYMMYIKFGFGRAWSDACIDIRRGALDRKQAIALVKAYDGHFPDEYLQEYLEYYRMTEEEFWEVIDSYRSPDIWEKKNGEWKLKFTIE